LIPEKIRPRRRKSWKAYDGVNNILNLCYEVLSWKIHRACLKAKLEPFLGFLHSVQYNKPSLVCDLEELYRYLVDDFAFDYIQGLKPGDFGTKEVQVRDRAREETLVLAKYIRNELKEWNPRISCA
jgi:CRISPR-associated protein Cas1